MLARFHDPRFIAAVIPSRRLLLFFAAMLVLMAATSLPLLSADPMETDSDATDIEEQRLAELRRNPPADALPEQTFAILPRTLFTEPGTNDEPDLSQFLVLGQYRDLYVMSRRQKTIWSVSAAGKTEVIYRDQRQGLLDFTDFTLLQNGLLALADQPRQAVFLFQQRRFFKGLGLHDNRRLFPSPRAVCTNSDRSLLGVLDAARNRGFVFSATGQLIAELSGPLEPCFFQNELVRTQVSGNRVQVSLVKKSGGTESLFVGEASPGCVLLDAQVAGAVGSALIVVCRQGKGDEDHPVWSRVFIYRAGTVRSGSIFPHLRLHSGSPKAYTVLEADNTLSLIDLDQHPDGIAIRSFRLP